jgi:large subunit ribosomal protein L10
MSREEKARTIDILQESLSKCNIGIFTDYRGMPNSEMTVLRGKLRELGVEYRVVKNTLAQFAAGRAGRDDLTSSFEGPVAIAFGYGDITDPARALADYIGAAKVSLSIKGGFLSDRLLTSDEVNTLATLPPKEILIAKLLGGMQSPITNLVNCLAAPVRGLMGVLQARIQQLEGE